MKHLQFWFWTSLISFAFLVGFTKSYHWPHLKKILLVEVAELTKEKSPLVVVAKDLEIGILPPSLSLKSIKLTAQGDLAKQLAPIRIQELRISPYLRNVLSGRLGVLQATLTQPQITIISRVQPEKKEKNQQPHQFDPSILSRLPIGKLALKNALFQIRIDSQDLKAQMSETDFTTRIIENGVSIQLKTPRFIFKKKEIPSSIALSIDTDLSLLVDQLQIRKLNLIKGQTFVSGSGSVGGDLQKRRFDNANLNLTSQLQLDELRDWFRETFPDQDIPEVTGDLQFNAQYKQVGVALPDLRIESIGKKLAVDEYTIGNLELAASSDTRFFTLPRVYIENPAGGIELRNTSFKLDKETLLQTELNLKKLELSTFLDSIDVKEVPAFVHLDAKVPCKGQLAPKFRLNCRGQVVGKGLHVKSGSGRTIAQLDRFKADGSFNVDMSRVKYKTQLEITRSGKAGKSTGSSNGTIIYDRGFKIDYSATQLHFDHILNLANFDIEGSTKLKGSTQGDSRSATLKMKLDSTNTWFENFWLGNLQTNLAYRKGVLSFAETKGQFGSSRYIGDMKVDINTEQLGANFELPFIDTTNIQTSLERRIPVPLKLSGTGQASVKLTGPFEVNRLTYVSEMKLFRGAIGSESFDDLDIVVHSNDGLSEIKKGVLRKGNSRIFVSGKGWPSGRIESRIRGRGLLLEDSEFLKKFGVNLKGNLFFDANLKGIIYHPDFDFSGLLTDLQIGDSRIPPSQIDLSYSTRALKAQMNFFGGKVSGDFEIPLQDDSNFHLNVVSQNWDYTPLLGIINPRIKSLNYSGTVDGAANLSSPKGKPWVASGQIILNKFRLARGDSSIRAQNPIVINLKKGVVESDNFDLSGKNAFLKAKTKGASARNFTTQFNGRVNMDLFAFATPFFEDLRGPASLSFKTGGTLFKPEILGSLFIEKGNIKFPDFPHPIEEIEADILFSQTQVLINSLKTKLTTGQVTATGSVQLESLNSIPMNIDVTASNTEILYPQKTRTKTSGRFKITNNWFPFKISGNVELESSQIDKEFSEFSDSKKLVKESPFLPELFVDTQTKLFELDLNVSVLDEIRIKNSMIETGFKGNFRVTGSPFEPQIQGKLAGTEGKLFFQGTPFTITKATVDFLGNKEPDPTLFFAADTRKNEYDVNFLLQGSSKKPDIRVTSQPALPYQDIVSLLAIGVTNNEIASVTELGNSEIDSNDQALGTALIGLSQGISRELKEQFDLSLSVSQDKDSQGAVQKIVITKEFLDRFQGSLTSSLGEEKDIYGAKLEMRVDKNLSVVTSIESESSLTTDLTNETNSDSVLGLDLEWKVKFGK